MNRSVTRFQNVRLAMCLSPQRIKVSARIILGDSPKSMVQDLQAQFPKAKLERGGKAFSGWIVQVLR